MSPARIASCSAANASAIAAGRELRRRAGRSRRVPLPPRSREPARAPRRRGSTVGCVEQPEPHQRARRAGARRRQRRPAAARARARLRRRCNPASVPPPPPRRVGRGRAPAAPRPGRRATNTWRGFSNSCASAAPSARASSSSTKGARPAIATALALRRLVCRGRLTAPRALRRTRGSQRESMRDGGRSSSGWPTTASGRRSSCRAPTATG